MGWPGAHNDFVYFLEPPTGPAIAEVHLYYFVPVFFCLSFLTLSHLYSGMLFRVFIPCDQM